MSKILVFNSNNFPTSVERLLRQILSGLAKGQQVFYCTSSKITGVGQKVEEIRFQRYRFGSKLIEHAWLFILFFPIFQLKVFFTILLWRTRGVKKIICFGLNEKFLTFIPAKLFGIKIYWTEWELLEFFNKKSFWRFIYKWWGKKVVIISVINKIKQQLTKLKIKEQAIHNIPAAINFNIFQKKLVVNQFKNKNIFRVGTICRLEANRGIEQMMHAVQNAREFIPDLRLTIVGDGSERKNFFWLAKKLEIDEIIQFSGFQSELNSWISSFDIFIYPILQPKSFSLTILQAMAYGRPVIACNVGALSEQIEDGKTGLLVEPGSSEEMAQSIIYLNRHPDILAKMGERGKEVVREKFDLGKVIERWRKIICLR